jgi:DNA polymerase elongation subunit (family B)
LIRSFYKLKKEEDKFNMFKREEVIPYSKDQDIVFQIISWHAFDQEDDDDDSDDGNPNMINKKYLVKVFGSTENGISVSANLTDFPPFFYIKSPINLNDYQVKMIKEFIVEKLHYKQKNSIQEVRAMKKKDFWGFTNDTKFTFVRISCKNLECFRAAARIFQKKVMIPAIWNKDLYFKLYENNIEPFLRLAHIRNINPAGWVKIPAKYHTAIKTSRCQIDVTCRWSAIESVQLEKMAPFVIASFDIECTSSHGDFPVANKNYKKTAIELINQLNCTLTKESLMQEILNIFNHNIPGKLSKIFTKKEVTDFNITMLKRNMDDIYALLNNKIKFTSSTRDSTIKQITETLTNILPAQEGDPIIQIGTTVHKYGDKECAYKNIITLGTCSDINDADVIVCNNEKELLLKWKQLINRLDPDVLIGYNIFGFDMSYMYERARELKIDKSFSEIGRLLDHESPYVEKALSSSALGDNLLKYIDMEGRVLIDIMKLVQRDHKLDSYKLDTVASSFLGGKVISGSERSGGGHENSCVVIDNIKGISVDSYIKFSDNDQKYKILSINVLESTGGYEITLDQPLTTKETKWGLAKDDITPRQIFESQNGTADDRAMIAKYCIKDCALCNYLLMKLETLANNVGMANVCSVPLSFIFMRGQGIKIFSLVAKQCRDDDYLIPCLNKYKPPNANAAADDEDEDEEGYEGAIVLEPKEGIYIDDPIAVLDYASLYPSSMISENLSHDCIVLDPKYDNLEGLEYLDIAYDIYEKVNEKKVKTGERVCRYVQLPEKGIIPRILMHLLKQRKVTRKKIEFKTVITEDGQSISGLLKDSGNSVVINDVIIDRSMIKSITDTYDDFQKAVLDGLQIAYKVTANSLYGQCGAKTSQIYMKDIAACTTATGRKMILMARDFIEQNYPAETIYGDTDSLFVRFTLKDGLGNQIRGKDAILPSIEMAMDASKQFKKYLKPPHDAEYEKTFYPFILFSKKRYCANKYEYDDKKCKMNSMGIVLKRRDNAQIVKTIYGGVLNIILNEQNIRKSIEFMKDTLKELIEGKFPMSELIVSKSLKSDYKDPDKIAHKMLADRMGERDEGNRPQANDRIPYVYVQMPPAPKGKKILQGERIEHPDYIIENSLKPDYEFYITNQIMKPCLQLYALVLEQLDGYKKNVDYTELKERLIKEKDGDLKKAKDRWHDLREEHVKKLLFDPILTKLVNKKNNNREITDYFKRVGEE